MEELNYPVKYAILELTEPGGYLSQYDDIVVGYIISKCHVISSTINYTCNGDYKLAHNVVFPYDNIRDFKRRLVDDNDDVGTRTIPSYDAMFDVYPTKTVVELFDTYDEAIFSKDKKNIEIYNKMISDLYNKIKNYKKAEEQAKEQYRDQMVICSFYERQIQLATNDMEVTYENDRAIKVLKPITNKKCVN